MDNVEKTSAGWLLAGILVNGRNEMASTLYCTVPRTHPPIGTIKVSNYSTIITFSWRSYANSAKSLSNVNFISYCSRFFFGDWGGVWWDECRSHFLPELLSRLKCSLYLDPLRWLDTVFQGQYLPSLSINYVTKSKVLEKLPPQLF